MRGEKHGKERGRRRRRKRNEVLSQGESGESPVSPGEVERESPAFSPLQLPDPRPHEAGPTFFFFTFICF